MKVLCIIEALGSGGAERQLVGLASMLKKDSYEVRVMTYYPKDFYKYILDEAGVDFCYLKSAKSKIKRVPVIASYIKRYSPDILICYSPSSAAMACLLKFLGFKYKLIVSERNSIRINNWREKIKFFCYKWADYIVPNSYEQELFIEKNYQKLIDKTTVITNFVDTEYFSPGEEYTCHQPCRIICVGRDNPQKNQLRFLESLKILVDKGAVFHVDWYGSFESSYGQKCKETIKDLGIEDFITLKGETKNVRDEYRTHDVFCLPSIYEGFPNVLCEAMSCGLPVVCSNVCDNPLIVQEGVNGLLFDPNNTEDMASTIREMILMPISEKDRISTANRKKAINMFSKDAFLAKYKQLIKR